MLYYCYCVQAWVSASNLILECGHTRRQDGCTACEHAGEEYACPGSCQGEEEE